MIKRIWVMPEKRDEKFSYLLIKKVYLFAKSLGITVFELEIKEQYTTEVEPHYHFHVTFGLCLDLPTTAMSATYIASANNEQHDGAMNIIFRSNGPHNFNKLIVSCSFFVYDEFIRKFYPEWKTTYQNIQLPH